MVGLVSWQLTIPGSVSLKDKRMVVRSLKDRLRHRFNVSVAETGHQEAWARAELSVAVVSGDVAFVESVLDQVARLVESDDRVLITATHRDIF